MQVKLVGPSGFRAHSLALDASAAVYTVTSGAARGHSSLVDQARRAAASVALNLAESSGRQGDDRRHFFRIAYGSAREAISAVSLLLRVGAIDGRAAHEAMTLLDQCCAVCWRLLHPVARN